MSSDPHVRFAHIRSHSARELMAQYIPDIEPPTARSIMINFDPTSEIKDQATGRREPKWAGALIEEWREPDREPKAREYVRPSDAMKCARQLGYVACGAEGEPMDDSGIFATSLGTLLHSTWQQGIERQFQEMRDAYRAEHGEDAVPGPGIPWTVGIEVEFDQDLELPGGVMVPIIGFADLIVYDSDGNALEVVDAKTKGGFAFKKMFKEGVDEGPWLQSWAYGKLSGAPDVAVMNIAKDNISVNVAASMKVSAAERYASEFVKATEELTEMGNAEYRRMWGVNRLVHDQGMLPRRMIPLEGDGTEIVAPAQGMFDNGTTTWRCFYCQWSNLCITDGPGRVPIPETSVLAIQRQEATSGQRSTDV